MKDTIEKMALAIHDELYKNSPDDLNEGMGEMADQFKREAQAAAQAMLEDMDKWFDENGQQFVDEHPCAAVRHYAKSLNIELGSR